MSVEAPGAGLVQKGDLPLEVERISHEIIGCAIAVHRELGPGLLEKIYEDALIYELGLRSIRVERQVDIVIPYKGVELRGQRLDLLVGGLVVVEVKSVSALLDVHSAQLLSYLRAARLPLGLLLNFNVTLLKTGLERVFNERSPHARAVEALMASRSSRPSR
jgi:GxxExxY protein